jgi:starch-binding outer membrane protein, SusD/RagB family
MKKAYQITIALLLLIVTGCNDYLDIVPKEVIREEDVWSNITNAEMVLPRMYNVMPDGFDDNLTGASDEAWHHWENTVQSAWKYNQGSWGPTDAPLGNWGGRYQDIRRANMFIENIDDVPLLAEQKAYYEPRIPRFKAEARFLRALFYFELYKRYGGVPLITETFRSISDVSALQLPRNTADEIVNFIVQECDEIAGILPLDYANEINEMGRATKGAALALKARALLYAASPLLNGNTLYAGIVNNDGTPLFNQTYDREKWKRAADAAKQVLDLGIYTLYSPTPDNPVNNYAQLFYSREWNETILPYTRGNSRGFEQEHFPNGYPFQGYGKMSIFQELVDDYEMSNGLPISDPASGYTTEGTWNGTMWDGKAYSAVSNVSNMYKDRDPRFYASVFFHYSNWIRSRHGRPVKLAYFGNRTAGNDSDGWPWNSGTHNMTGYGMRKWNSPNVDLLNQQGDALRNTPIFRLAEVYLTYAEAMNEYLDVPDQSVYDAVNAVRTRAGMPNLPAATRASDLTKEGMRQRIRNERRVELVFEGHRFWDVRRWMIAADHDGIKGTDNTILHALNNRPTEAELAATGLNPMSEEAGVAVFYKVVPAQSRTFQTKHYLFPIPKTELDKDHNLVQNYGW